MYVTLLVSISMHGDIKVLTQQGCHYIVTKLLQHLVHCKQQISQKIVTTLLLL